MFEARDLELRGRRSQDRRIFQRALLGSLVLHLLILFVTPTARVPLESGGVRAPEVGQALEGILQLVQTSQAAPAAAPPPVPTVEVIVPEPEVAPPEPVVEVEPPPVDLPASGSGNADGNDPDAVADAGASGGGGVGDTGSGDGAGRSALPTPRGLIIPPTNRELRGSQVEIWVFVNEAGRVVPDSTELRPPTSNRGFNEQLMREAAQWVFNPAREEGAPVAAWFRYRIGM